MVPISSEETMPATLGRLRDVPRAAAGADARPLHCGGVDGDLDLGRPAAAEVDLEAGWNCDDEHITSTIHVAGGGAGRYEIWALELRRIERRDQLLGGLRLVLAAESRHQSRSPSTIFTEFVVNSGSWRSEFIFRARSLWLLTVGLEGPTGCHLKHQAAEQSSGNLIVGTAHLAEGEDEHIQVSSHVQTDGLTLGRILKHLRGRAIYGF